MCTFVKKNIYSNREGGYHKYRECSCKYKLSKFGQGKNEISPKSSILHTIHPPQPVLEMYNIIEQLKNIIITTSLPSNQTDIVLTSTFISQKSYAKKEMRILFEFLNEHRQVLTA